MVVVSGVDDETGSEAPPSNLGERRSSKGLGGLFASTRKLRNEQKERRRAKHQQSIDSQQSLMSRSTSMPVQNSMLRSVKAAKLRVTFGAY